MTLTIAQLEDALWCAHFSLDGHYRDEDIARCNQVIVALEAELSRLEAQQYVCSWCKRHILTTDSHSMLCESPNWLPKEQEAK